MASEDGELPLPIDEALFEIVSKGLHGTAMLPWGDVQEDALMDIIHYIKTFSPDDESETRNIERHASDEEPFSGLAFKIMNDPFVGSLTFTRIYSGVLKKGDSIINSTKVKPRDGRCLGVAVNIIGLDTGELYKQ